MPQSTIAVPMHDPRGISGSTCPIRPAVESSLNGDEDQVDGEVFQGLEDRDREPPPGLIRVVHAEPLVRGVAAACHHQLGAQQPAQCPAGQEDGCHQVEGPTERELGAAAPREDDADRDRQQQAAEGGEAALPDGQNVSRPLRVVAQVREHVHGPGAHHGSEDDPEEDGDEPVGGVAVLPQPALEVHEAEPERERESDAVGVDLEGPDVEGDGDRSHGSVRARLRPGGGHQGPGRQPRQERRVRTRPGRSTKTDRRPRPGRQPAGRTQQGRGTVRLRPAGAHEAVAEPERGGPDRGSRVGRLDHGARPDVHRHVLGTAGAVEEEITGLEVADRHRRRVRHLRSRVVGE